MVGTAQADNFAVFIRKIGYSVGVEAILKRASDFGKAYASVANFRESDWDALVEGAWGLRSSNVADVFNALDLAKIHNREVYPGQMGEALGILNKLYSQGAPELAVQLIVATSIVRADGDIFLNALRSGFHEDETAKALVRMIHAKREALFQIFSTPRDREAVARAVSIERQRTNRGSAAGGGLAALTRGAPLDVKAQGLGLPRKMDVQQVENPSSDYLRKITVSRKGWAESLGLFAKGQLTSAGEKFLIKLAEAGFSRRDGTFIVWPTIFEIESNKFQADSFKQLGLLSTWEQQLAVFRAFGGRPGFAPDDTEIIANSLARIYDAYRDLSQHRSVIRNEVSSSVVAMVMLSIAFAEERLVPELDRLWTDPAFADCGIAIRPSKTIEFAISVRSDAR